MKKKSKVVDFLETIFYGAFALAIMAWMLYGLYKLGLKSLFIVIPISAILICLTISCKKDARKEKKYHDKYITEEVITDKIFGEIKFKYDTAKMQLTGKLGVLFGEYNPTIIISDFQKSDIEGHLRALEYLYSVQDVIIKNLLNQFLEIYSESTKSTKKASKEDFNIRNIRIEKRGERFLESVIEFEGEYFAADDNPNELVIIVEPETSRNCGFLVAYMDFESKKICYALFE